jgi:hypothetical protein
MTLIFFAGIAMLGRVIYQIVLPLEMVDNINVTSYVRLDSMVWGIVLAFRMPLALQAARKAREILCNLHLQM